MKRKAKVKRPVAAKKVARKGAKKSVKAIAKKIAKPKPSPAPTVTPKSDTLDALVLASTQALRLPLDPAWHGGIKFNLQLILRLGAVVDEFPLPDDAEPGPVFHA